MSEPTTIDYEHHRYKGILLRLGELLKCVPDEDIILHVEKMSQEEEALVRMHAQDEESYARLVSENAALRERGEALEAALAEEKRLTMALAGESDRLREALQRIVDMEFLRGDEYDAKYGTGAWVQGSDVVAHAALAAHEPQEPSS